MGEGPCLPQSTLPDYVDSLPVRSSELQVVLGGGKGALEEKRGIGGGVGERTLVGM